MPIKADEFETYETIILSGQMPQEDAPKFMQENPEFARWYRERRGLSSAGRQNPDRYATA